MAYSPETIDAAHRHSSNHREELSASEICGCFYCCLLCTADEVEVWLEDAGGTALCPHCGIDSVIGSASGYPVGDVDFLRVMRQRWFG